MKILPYENVTFRTTLPIDEISTKLSHVTDHRKPSNFTSRLGKQNHAYQGLVTNEGFTILRNIDYRNSFRPVVYGKFRSAIDYSEINVEMKMHKFVRVFMSIWLIGVSIAAIAMLIDAIRSSNYGFQLFAAPGMFLVGYFLSKIAFTRESDHVKKDFEELFQAKIIEVNP